jgi:hypothetical protein
MEIVLGYSTPLAIYSSTELVLQEAVIDRIIRYVGCRCMGTMHVWPWIDKQDVGSWEFEPVDNINKSFIIEGNNQSNIT